MIDNQRYVMKEKEEKRGNFESSGGTGKTGARIKRVSAAHSTLHRSHHPPPDRHRPKSQAFGSHPVLCSYKTSPCNTHACKQDTVTDTNQSSSNKRNPLSPYSLGLCNGLVCMATTFRRCGDGQWQTCSTLGTGLPRKRGERLDKDRSREGSMEWMFGCIEVVENEKHKSE